MDIKTATEFIKLLEENGYPLKKRVEHKEGEVMLERIEIFEFPALEELIEACHTRYSLYFKLEKNAYGWNAYVSNGEEDVGVSSGVSAVEAVARLWIFINKMR